MRKLFPIFGLAVAAGLMAITSGGCSRQARVGRHLAQANRYFAAGQFDQAEVEYLNVLQAAALNPEAVVRLGLIYADEGRASRAVPFLRKARELQPDNLEVRLKLGLIDLAARQLDQARDEAEFVLARRPGDDEAPLLLANAAGSSQEMADVRERLGHLSTANGAPVLIALGTLDFRQDRPQEAEELFRRAQTQDPKSAKAYAALAMLDWTRKNPSRADEAFQRAVTLAPARSPIRLQYVQFEIQRGDLVSARRLLEEMTRSTPDYLPAWLSLGELAAAEQKLDEASAFAARVLARDQANPGGLILSGRLQLAKGDNDHAVQTFERMQGLYPQSPQAAYELGRACAAAGNTAKAMESLRKAVSLAPDYADAIVLLANLNIRKGDASSAIVALKPMVTKHPELAAAWLVLADAYRAQGSLDDANAVYGQMVAAQPTNPQARFLLGLALLQQHRNAEARQAFEKALELAAGYLPAVEQLVNLDLAGKNYPAALQRAQAEITRNPKSAQPLLLLAKVHLAQKETAQAETALKQAIAVEPDFLTTYLFLARLYVETNQNGKALANLAEVVAKNPKDVAAWMLTGVIHEQQKDYAAAREAYEKLLTVNPRFGPALNNLAWLYAEHFHELDKAFALAQRARELLPGEPHAADTLGWILYQRRQYPWALSLLQESAGKLPAEAEVQFHLGMVHYMMGEEQPARLALQRALQLQAAFSGADEARQCLAILDLDVNAVGAGAQTTWEKTLQQRTNDPVALARLATIDERSGAPEAAFKAWQGAVDINPGDVYALVNLARLEAARGNLVKARQLADTARKAAPDNPEAAYALGRVVFQAGDYLWASSLLQQAAASRPDDPEVRCDLAQALYSVGRVSAAQDAMRRALNAKASFSRTSQAREFLHMTELAANPAQAAEAVTEVEQALKSDPGDVPALMALAAAREQRSEAGEAKKIYATVLNRYPDFAPAQRRFAILSAEDATELQKAFDTALKARQTYPDDPELAKALGIIVYRRGDYARAVSLLQEGAGKRDKDAELMYYLGMAQHSLGNDANSRQSLQRALDLGLAGDRAANAKRVLVPPK